MDAILEVPGRRAGAARLRRLGGALRRSRRRRPTAGGCIVLPAVPPAELSTGRPRRRDGHGDPADDRQPRVHDAPEALRGDRRRRPRGRVGPAGHGRDRPATGRGALRPDVPRLDRRSHPAYPDRAAGRAGDMRAHILDVARERYNWGAQLSTLFGLYGSSRRHPSGTRLLPRRPHRRPEPRYPAGPWSPGCASRPRRPRRRPPTTSWSWSSTPRGSRDRIKRQPNVVGLRELAEGVMTRRYLNADATCAAQRNGSRRRTSSRP